MALQPDGKILLGGDFYIGTNWTHAARLNANGSLENTFNAGTITNFSPVYSMVLQPDGKLLIGGYDFLARLNSNGSVDNSFSPADLNGGIASMALQPDGKILIGGNFTSVNGLVRPYVARLYGESGIPSLTIARSNALMVVSWPASAAGYSLQESTNLGLANSWLTSTQSTSTNAGQIFVTLPADVQRKFFRLLNQTSSDLSFITRCPLKSAEAF